jgi:hypothetical protein
MFETLSTKSKHRNIGAQHAPSPVWVLLKTNENFDGGGGVQAINTARMCKDNFISLQSK